MSRIWAAIFLTTDYPDSADVFLSVPIRVIRVIRVIRGFILCVVAGPAVTAEIFEMMDIFRTRRWSQRREAPGVCREVPGWRESWTRHDSAFRSA